VLLWSVSVNTLQGNVDLHGHLKGGSIWCGAFHMIHSQNWDLMGDCTNLQSKLFP